MNQRQIEDRLRSWYRATADAQSPRAALRARVLAVPEAAVSKGRVFWAPGFRPQSSLVFAAIVLVLTLLLTMAVAVGSGLIDLRRPIDQALVVIDSPSPSLPVAAPATPATPSAAPTSRPPVPDCGPVPDDELPNGRVLTWEGDPEVLIYENGLLLEVGRRTPTQVRSAADNSILAQWLAPSGVELYRRTVVGSGLLTPGCHIDRLFDGSVVGIDAWIANGRHAITHWGQYGGFDQRLTAEEAAAAANLQGFFVDRDELVGAGYWVERQPVPFDPQRWHVDVSLEDETAPDEPWEIPVSAFQVVTPDGTRVADLGSAYVDNDGMARRCTNMNAANARALAQSLDAAGGTFFDGSFWFTRGADLIAIQINPLLPHEWGCPIGARDGPPPDQVDTCDLLAQALFGPEATADGYSSGAPSQSFRSAHGPEAWDADGCQYGWPDSFSKPSLSLRTRATSRTEAYELISTTLAAPEVFVGDGQQLHWEAAGVGTWSALSANEDTWHAVAVSAGPYFFVVTALTYDRAVELADGVSRALDVGGAVTWRR